MFQEPEFSLKRDIALTVAVEAAGFKITNSKSIPTEDGYAWHATLVHGLTKIVTVSNGGTGGEDHSDFHATTDVAKAADKIRLQELFAIPEVTAVLRDHLLYNLNLSQQFNKVSESDYFASKDQIAGSTPVPSVDNVEYLVGYLATAFKLANELKRALKTKLVFVRKGQDATGEYGWYVKPDTAANRATAQGKQSGTIDYFVADLFATAKEGMV
jgi:hypothetical protein